METRPLRFVRRGEVVALDNVPPDRMLLELLREDLGCSGTKEGCGEGDCGACTVVLGELEGGALRYRAINSCIALAHSVDGRALWTVQDLAQGGTLHPAQEAMVTCHASQCGFCTPGFVMSLFALYQDRVCQGETVTRDTALEALSGNLCRCTGYRPILDAAVAMGEAPRATVDEAALAPLLQAIARPSGNAEGYLAPTSLQALLAARAAHPHAQVVAGCTDVGLWVTKMHKQFPQVLDVTRAAELRTIENHEGTLRIGAAVSLEAAFAAIAATRPQVRAFANRFAGLPVRNAGTLGGNVANGSPIGDSMPLLIALDARVVLASARGVRELPIEDFYTGYRQNVLAADELLAFVDLPLPGPDELMRAYKVSKRYEDDISAVCLVISLQLHGGLVVQASIGVGGVAATPVRARAAEAALAGQPWTHATARAAAAALQGEFSPISDMRASAAYRSAMLASLVERFWLDSQGQPANELEHFVLEDGA